MKHQRVALEVCCTKDDGTKAPFHLCCRDCRQQMAAAYRTTLLRDGRAPDACGPEPTKLAPARGRVVQYRPSEVVSDGKGGNKVIESGHFNRSAMRQEDVLDIMNDQARRRGGACVFDAHQVSIAREYRALFERCASSGVKCSAAFDAKVGSSSKVDFMDAYMRDVERMDRFNMAIGSGVALRARQHGRRYLDAPRRLNLADIDLVEMVCVWQRDLSGILVSLGWSVNGRNRKHLQVALSGALDRMLGI